LSELGITPEEGMRTLDRIFSSDYLNRLIVATGDLSLRISQWVKLENLKKQQEDGTIADSEDEQINEETGISSEASEVEQGVIRIWTDLLGADEIEVTDDFFKLGGSSLIATQVVARIRDLFEVDLAISDMFDFKTVDQLSKRIEALREVKNDQYNKLQGLLEEFENQKVTESGLLKQPSNDSDE